MKEGKPHLKGLKPCPDGGLKLSGSSSSREAPLQTFPWLAVLVLSALLLET